MGLRRAGDGTVPAGAGWGAAGGDGLAHVSRGAGHARKVALRAQGGEQRGHPGKVPPEVHTGMDIIWRSSLLGLDIFHKICFSL